MGFYRLRVADRFMRTFIRRYSADLGILIVYSIKSSVSVLLDCALIPDSRIVSIALLIVLRKIRMSFITALLFPLTREGFGVELR